MKKNYSKMNFKKRSILKFFLFISLMFTLKSAQSQVLFTESFDNLIFPPTGWTDILTSGTNVWSRVGAGTFPNQLPHSGGGQAKFNTYDVPVPPAGIRSLMTPALDFTASGTKQVSFWMYRDNGYPTAADKIEVLISTAPTPTSVSTVTLGTINRSTILAPTVSVNGWYQYIFIVPASFNTATNYIFFRGTSLYGNNTFMDDISVENLLTCSGTPNSGTATVAGATGCTGSFININASGLTSALGLTYQWRSSSSDAGPWTNIVGATSTTYPFISTTGKTYYQLVTTCTVSASSNTTNPVVFVGAPLPVNINVTGSTTICAGSNAVLAASTTTSSGPSNAVICDGVDDYLIGNVSGTTLTDFTIETFIRPDATPQASKGIFQWASNLGDAYPMVYFQQSSSNLDVYVNSNYNLSVPLVLNSWNHVALSYSTGVYKLYLNGSLVSTYNGAITNQANATKIFIGNGYGGYWKGNMDELRIWNIARSSTQIATSYSMTVPNNSVGLLDYYQFNETSGTITNDNTVSAIPLTLTNGVARQISSTAPIFYNIIAANTYAWSTGNTGNTIFVAPTVTTVYGLTASSTLYGCSGTSSPVTISVNAKPTVTVNSGAICNGSSFTMTPSGANTYVYTGGSATVSPTTNTNYNVIGTSVLGCTNNAVSSVTVYANPVVSVNSGTICNGSSFTMNPSGALSYVYSSGSALVSPTTNSSYTVTGTNAFGCSSNAVSNVTVNAIPTVAVNSGAICNGSSFTMIPSGASTYVYSSGSALVSPTANTSYTVTGTAAGCSNTAISSVTVNAIPTVAVNSGAICNGSSFTMIPSGASTYVYSSGSALVSPTANTNYTVTGTSASGCSSAAVSSVTVNSIPSITLAPASICTGGSYTFTPTGASTYTYSGGSAVVSPLANTTYTVSGTSAAGCVGSSVITVTVSGSLAFSVNSGSICSGKSFTMTPSGASTYTYSSGSSIVSPTSNSTYTVIGASASGCLGTAIASVTVNANPSVTVNSGSICSGSSFTMNPSGALSYVYTGGSASVSPTTNTSYTVTGTNALGCTNTAISTVTVNTIPTVVVNSGAICNGSSFTMTPSGASSYVYSGGLATVNPSITTTYSVTGTNAAGCSNTALSTVTVNAIPTIVIPPAGVCTGGSHTFTPSGAATYTYSSGSAIVTPASTTNYTISGTSAAGCIGSAVTTVTVSGTLIFAVNSGSICAGNSFTMTPSGAATYTYSSVSPVVSPTTNTTYTVTGASATGCIGTAISSVTVNAIPTIAVNSGSVCNGSSFVMTPSGAATYVYSGGSATVSPTANTNYTVTGTNASGCSNTAVSNVTVNATPTLAVNSGSICSGSNFTFTPTGSTTYSYSSGSAVVTPSVTTSYTISTTNAFGCAANSVKTITVGLSPVIVVSSGGVCTGGSWTITPTGAATYTYSSGSAIVTPTSTTNYTVSGSNSNGCQSLSVMTVSVSTSLLFSSNSGSVCQGNTFTMTPTGATSYTYSSGTPIVTPTTTTTYTINAVNAAGCLGTNICTVTVNALPTLTVNNGAICIGQTFTLNPTGANTYTYSSGSNTVNPIATTNYSVTGTTSNGCVTASVSVVTVTVNALPTLTVNSGAICAGQTFTIVPTGASTYTYSSGSNLVNPSAITDYTVTGTDANGCVTAANAISTVSVNALPTVTAISDFTTICNGEVATLTAGGAASYVWNTGATTATAATTPTTTTTYSVDGTDGNGCVNSANVTVNVNACVGIQQLSSAKLNVSVHPNPTTGLVTLELNSPTQITITNALGQVILTETVFAGKQTLDLKNQTNGLYFMNLNQHGQQQTIKVIKN